MWSHVIVRLRVLNTESRDFLSVYLLKSLLTLFFARICCNFTNATPISVRIIIAIIIKHQRSIFPFSSRVNVLRLVPNQGYFLPISTHSSHLQAQLIRLYKLPSLPYDLSSSNPRKSQRMRAFKHVCW